MKPEPLPASSAAYAEQAWLAKERWHRKKASMSFARKLAVLDRLREAKKDLPKLEEPE